MAMRTGSGSGATPKRKQRERPYAGLVPVRTRQRSRRRNRPGRNGSRPTKNNWSSSNCQSRIEALETEQKQLQALVSSQDFYKHPASEIHEALARLEELETLLLAAYTRWDALDSRT